MKKVLSYIVPAIAMVAIVYLNRLRTTDEDQVNVSRPEPEMASPAPGSSVVVDQRITNFNTIKTPRAISNVFSITNNGKDQLLVMLTASNSKGPGPKLSIGSSNDVRIRPGETLNVSAYFSLGQLSRRDYFFDFATNNPDLPEFRYQFTAELE